MLSVLIKSTKSFLGSSFNLMNRMIGYCQLRQDQTKNQIRHIQAVSRNWVQYRLPLHRLNFDYAVSRALFGNVACVSNNIAGPVRKLNAKIRAFDRPSTPPSPLAKQLRKDGFAKVPWQLDSDLMQQISEKYQRLIEDDETSIPNIGSLRISLPKDQYFSRTLKRHAFRELPEVGSFLTDDLMQLVEDYYGSYFEVVLVDSYRTYHAPAEISAQTEVFSDWWHCDQYPTDRLILFIALSDITEEDGPFHVVSRSRTKELIQLGFRHRWDYGAASSIMNDPAHVSKFVGPKGTAMLCSTPQCLHRASIPAPGRTRDLIQIMLQSSTVPLPQDWYWQWLDQSTEQK